MFKNEHYCSDLEIKGVAKFMLLHSLRTNVLHSLHNNTQQPVIYLVDGKSVVVYVVLIWEEPAEQSLPYHSQHFHKTTHLPTVLRSKMSALKLSHQW